MFGVIDDMMTPYNPDYDGEFNETPTIDWQPISNEPDEPLDESHDDVCDD